eukprot:Rhum_TRINITY_DN12067_c0_g1::Rhum_TRINITY_DN12067_c0_g1_i1::g.48470::m.48470
MPHSPPPPRVSLLPSSSRRRTKPFLLLSSRPPSNQALKKKTHTCRYILMTFSLVFCCSIFFYYSYEKKEPHQHILFYFPPSLPNQQKKNVPFCVRFGRLLSHPSQKRAISEEHSCILPVVPFPPPSSLRPNDPMVQTHLIRGSRHTALRSSRRHVSTVSGLTPLSVRKHRFVRLCHFSRVGPPSHTEPFGRHGGFLHRCALGLPFTCWPAQNRGRGEGGVTPSQFSPLVQRPRPPTPHHSLPFPLRPVHLLFFSMRHTPCQPLCLLQLLSWSVREEHNLRVFHLPSAPCSFTANNVCVCVCSCGESRRVQLGTRTAT